MGYRVNAVTIKARWISTTIQKRIENIVGIGELFDSKRYYQAIIAVREEIEKEEKLFVVQLLGSTSVLVITAKVCKVATTDDSKLVDIIIYPFYIRIDLFNIGKNVIPSFRSAKPTFYSGVPGALSFFNPSLNIGLDRSFGPSVSISTFTDFLHLFQSVKKNTDAKKYFLGVNLTGTKSFSREYYNVSSEVSFGQKKYSDSTIGWAVSGQGEWINEPYGKVHIIQSSLQGLLQLQGTARFLIFSKYELAGGYKFSKIETDHITSEQEKNREFKFSGIVDGKTGTAFNRFGVWIDGGNEKFKTSMSSYTRIGSSYGLLKAFGKGHQTLDLQIIGSGAYTFGSLQTTKQFYAGSTKPFINESLESQDLQSMADGPRIRSLGKRQGVFNSTNNLGGTSYVSLSFDLAVPIKSLSRPLIPDIVINEETGTTAAKAIKGQANFAESLIADDLVENHGLSGEDADRKAEEIVNKDIRPSINYLADKANLFSIKPVLYFDIASMSRPNFTDEIWSSAGIGISLNIVNAKLVVGYLHTLSPSRYQKYGNLILTFLIQSPY
jgi:hypothetical protein